MSEPEPPAAPADAREVRGTVPSGPDAPRRVIRSVPTPIRGTALLSTYAANYSGDASWRRGAAWIWALFGLIALTEAVGAVFRLLAGVPAVGVGRLVLLSGVFLTLWAGWNWTRWLLAIVAFLLGLSWLGQLMAATDLALRFGYHRGQTLPGSSVINAPVLVAALLYLVLSAFLAFSSDLVAFTKHRREEGRAWLILPVSLLLAGYLVGMIALEALSGRWLVAQRPAAVAAGHDILRELSDHWDSRAFDARVDPAGPFGNAAPDQRAASMAYLRPLGPLRTASREDGNAYCHFNSERNRFELSAVYVTAAEFAHGRAEIELDLTRSLFGPWQVSSIGAEKIHVDPTPAPTSPPAVAPPVPSAGG